MGNAVRVFLNAKSGSGGATAEQIALLFAKHDCPCTVTRVTKSLDAARLVKADPMTTVFVAAGGDGTVNLVASLVAGTDRPMGVLPVGTLNHFARDLRLPLELEAAVEVIASGIVRTVDAAEVSGELFVNNSSLGTYPEMVIRRERMKKAGRNKWASLVAASFRAFLRFRCLTVEFSVKGEVHRCTTPFLFVGNNEYCLDGTRLGARDHLDRGVLSLYLAPGATRSTMLRLTFAALLGKLKELPEFAEFKTTGFRVFTRRRRMRVSLDGEVKHFMSPVTYALRPASLHVMCGADKDADSSAPKDA